MSGRIYLVTEHLHLDGRPQRGLILPLDDGVCSYADDVVTIILRRGGECVPTDGLSGGVRLQVTGGVRSEVRSGSGQVRSDVTSGSRSRIAGQ